MRYFIRKPNQKVRALESENDKDAIRDAFRCMVEEYPDTETAVTYDVLAADSYDSVAMGNYVVIRLCSFGPEL